MKNVICKLLCLILILTIVFSVPAAAAGNFVSDEAGLLNENDIAVLNESASAVYDAEGIAVFVATVDTLDGADVVDTADLLLESTGVQEGILLFLAMEDRDYAISTMGEATIWYFNDYNLHQMEEIFLPYLSEGEYVRGFEKFISLCNEVIAYEKANASNSSGYGDYNEYNGYDGYDGYTRSRPAIFSPIRLIVCLALGLLLAGIPLARHKKAIQNVSMKTNASEYVRNGSLKINTANDIFLYRHVNRIPRNVDNGSNRSGGSRPGGTTHFSSSGISHGGSHGKF